MNKIRAWLFKNRNYEDVVYISKLVKKERKINQEFESLIRDKKKPLWIPSISAFIKITFFFLMIGLISHIGTTINSPYLDNITIPVIKSDSITFQNLIAIITGIGAVLIGLAFYVAQSLMDKDDPDKARVLLYNSGFFPLLASVVYIFIILLFGDVNGFIILVVIGLGIVTIVSLGKTVKILINSNDLENAKSKVFFDILRKNFIKILDSEINRRISNNILFEIGNRLEKEYDGTVVINPLRFTNRNNYIAFKALKDGKYVDLNLRKLRHLINEIIKVPSNKIDIDNDYKTNINLMQDTHRKVKDPLLIIRPMLLNKITSNTPLIKVRRDLINDMPILSEKINKSLYSIFILRDPDDFEQDARFEISKLKERCIGAIETSRTSELEKTIKVYNELIKEFFNYMQFYGNFNKDQAEKERGTLFNERLKFLDWITDDIREIFERAMKIDNKDIIKYVAFLPISLAKLSIENKDHLIYQNFISYPQLIYISAYKRKDEDKEIADFMIDRSWRYITELSDFYLVTHYKNGEIMSPEEFKDFAQYIFKVFQGLIKLSYEYRDEESFKIFIKRMMGLFRGINYGYRNQNMVRSLNEFKKEVVFGLGSWILSEVLDGKVDKKEFLLYLIEVLPKNINDITDLFVSVHNFDTNDRWGWDNWELDNHDDFEAFTIDTFGKLEKFYAFVILRNLKNKTDDSILNIKLPTSKELAMISKSTNSFMRTLDIIKSGKSIWREILSDKAIKKVDILMELLKNVKAEQEEIERETIRNARISEEKVQKFKANVIKNLRETFGVKSIYKNLDKVIDLDDKFKSNSNNKLGINTFFDKAAFLSDDIEPNVIYMGIEDGFDFGRSIIHGENRKIINQLKRHLSEIDEDNIEHFLLDFDRVEDLIFLSVNYSTFHLFESSGLQENYIPNWHSNFPTISSRYKEYIQGIYKIGEVNIPVYDVFTQENNSELIIVDKNNMGKIIQYLPSCEDKDIVYNDFYIDVQEITNNSTKEKEILDNPPQWLKKIGIREEQKKYLREKVIIHIFEMFELKVAEQNKIKGGVVKVKEQ